MTPVCQLQCPAALLPPATTAWHLLGSSRPAPVAPRSRSLAWKDRPFLDLNQCVNVPISTLVCVSLLVPASTREQRSPRCSSCSSPAPSVVLQSPAILPVVLAKLRHSQHPPDTGALGPASSLQRQLQLQRIRLELATLAYSTMPLFGKSSLYAEIVG